MQSYNQLTGSIPSGEISRDDNTKSGWSNLDRLDILFLDQNQITGTIPYDFLDGLSSSLEELDLGSNNLVGSLPSALGKMTMLEMLDVHGNQLTGRLPPEMNRMYPDVELNLTDNL
jgi:Leucine-rich repeat (LRR) protein